MTTIAYEDAQKRALDLISVPATEVADREFKRLREAGMDRDEARSQVLTPQAIASAAAAVRRLTRIIMEPSAPAALQ